MDLHEIDDEVLVDIIQTLENQHSNMQKGKEETILVEGEVEIQDLGTLEQPGEQTNTQVSAKEDVSIEKAREYIESQRKENTVRATLRDVRNLQDWLAEKKFELRNIEDIDPRELADYLTQYFIFIEKKDGTQYQPSTLTNMLYGLDRHLRNVKYSYIGGQPVNILKDTLFHEPRTALASKRIDLKKQGLGNRPNRSVGLESGEEEILWQKEILGRKNGFSIQFSLWYHMTLIMGLRGRDEHRRVTFGDLSLKTDHRNVEFLELADRGGKTRDGAMRDDMRSTCPKIFCSCDTTGNNRCIIEIYKEFVNRRPNDFCNADHPFYLQVKTNAQISSSGTQIWFKREPLGVGSLGKFLPKACTLAGITPRGNHGVRATTVQRLREAKVPDDKIIQITGHKSVRTLAIYDTEKLHLDQHKEMQSILQEPMRKKPCTISSASTTTSSESATSTESVQQSLATTGQFPAPLNPSAIVNMHNMHSNVVNHSLQTPNAVFSGALITNCIFNINAVTPHDGSGDN